MRLGLPTFPPNCCCACGPCAGPNPPGGAWAMDTFERINGPLVGTTTSSGGLVWLSSVGGYPRDLTIGDGSAINGGPGLVQAASMLDLSGSTDGSVPFYVDMVFHLGGGDQVFLAVSNPTDFDRGVYFATSPIRTELTAAGTTLDEHGPPLAAGVHQVRITVDPGTGVATVDVDSGALLLGGVCTPATELLWTHWLIGVNEPDDTGIDRIEIGPL